MFDKRTEEAIGFYVYCLIDPRDDKPFYVGKGVGNRVFAHANDALESGTASDKLDIIRDITDAGQNVGYVIVRHGLDEQTAFSVETALIDFLNFFDVGLTNIVLGHNSSAFGLMTVDEVKRKYTAKPLKKLGEDCVIININRTYKRAKGTKSFYEATKEMWVMAEWRTKKIKYVLSEYGGFIVEVFEVNEGGWYKVADHNGKQRWGFEGKQAPNDVRDRYLNRAIKKQRGRANPVLYTV